jgi:tetratricopeptide (TPR) repeat protein
MSSPDAPVTARAGGRLLAAAVIVGLLAALPFLPGVASRTFITMDDDVYVTANARVRAGLGLAGGRYALTTFDGGNWHPLTWISHLADISLFGLDARGHHLTSILIHALAAAALCVALYRLTGALGRSAAVASLFGVHPLHVESVAWVAERKDVLSGLFFALALLAYARFARRPGPGRLAVVAVALALGLAAKPMLVTVPAVLLLLDFWPLGRAPRGAAWTRLLAEKLPLVVLSAGSAALTVLAQRGIGAVTPLEVYTPGMRLGNALVSYAAYLGATFWPAGLAVYYPHPMGRLPLAQVAAAALALAAVSWFAWSGRRRRPYLPAGWLWYLGTLVPVIGLVQVGGQARADRYTYLPLIGVFLMLAWWLPATRVLRDPRARAGAAAAVVLLLSGLSVVQVSFWRDSETLFRRALAATSNNWMIHNNLAGVLVARGRPDEAIEQYRASLRIHPTARTHNSFGTVLLNRGRIPEALEQFRLAVHSRPTYASPWNNLGLVSAMLGRFDEAIGHYQEALRLKPDLYDAALGLGRALHARGRVGEAAEAYRTALRIRPDSAEARAGLASVTRR